MKFSILEPEYEGEAFHGIFGQLREYLLSEFRQSALSLRRDFGERIPSRTVEFDVL